MNQGEKYEKFLVMYSDDNVGGEVPWTGIDQTLAFVKEKLESGFSVHVKPYTRKEWAKK